MSHSNLKKLTDANFATEVMQSDKPTLVDFWASWCAPCKAIAPHVDKLAEKFADQLNVGKMDIDASPKIPTQYDVRSIPTLLIFHKGKVIGQLVGAAPFPKIEQFVKDALAKSAN